MMVQPKAPAPVVLVTGGAGYVGSHACKALAAAGCLPVTYDSLACGHKWAVKWGPLEIGDVSDRIALDAAIGKHRPIAVMHFAAYADVGESVDDPGKYYRNNVAGSLTLLEAMRDHAIDQLVFSSTCATYGIPDSVPICEKQRQVPVNPYGMTKFAVEQMIGDFGQAHGLRSVAFRYFNAAGADPDGEIGEAHQPETHLIPLVLDAASGRREQIKVFGTDYDTPDGTCIRDYVHVTDLAEAHVRAVTYLQNGRQSAAFNLANGNGFSVRQVIAAAEKVTGCKILAVNAPRRAGDPAVLVGDASQARQQLGWEPQYTEIEEIVATAWSWHQKNPGGGFQSPPKGKAPWPDS